MNNMKSFWGCDMITPEQGAALRQGAFSHAELTSMCYDNAETVMMDPRAGRGAFERLLSQGFRTETIRDGMIILCRDTER